MAQTFSEIGKQEALKQLFEEEPDLMTTPSWDGFRSWFTSLGSRLSALWKKKEPHIDVTYGGQYSRETAYRQQKKQEEEELNRILDKIKKSGYSQLTDEEKRRLFDMSKK